MLLFLLFLLKAMLNIVLNFRNTDFDVALLVLSSKLHFTYPQGIRPVCLPYKETLVNYTTDSYVSSIKLPPPPDYLEEGQEPVESYIDYTADIQILTTNETYASTFKATTCLPIFEKEYDAEKLVCVEYNFNLASVMFKIQ